MSSLTHSLPDISAKDDNRRLRRSWRHCQHWRQNNHQPPLCWWHRWLSRRERRMTKLVERLEKPSTAYGMEISAEKTKLMTNDNKEIKGNGHKLQTVTNFRYMCSVEGAMPEIVSRIAPLQTSLEWQEYFSQCQATNWYAPCSLVTSIFL